jgi:serine/threonine-protein kinase
MSAGLKLLDFGLAKTPEDTAAQPGTPARAALAIVGTPEYMAPEQVASGRVDGRADLYALGCVLYEMVTGRLPFVADSPVALLDAKIKGSPERARDRAPARRIPPHVDELLMRALARHPSVRFQSAAEMRHAVEVALEVPARARARRRAVGFAALAVAMAFAGALLVGKGRDLGAVVPRAAALLPASWYAAPAAPAGAGTAPEAGAGAKAGAELEPEAGAAEVVIGSPLADAVGADAAKGGEAAKGRAAPAREEAAQRAAPAPRKRVGSEARHHGKAEPPRREAAAKPAGQDKVAAAEAQPATKEATANGEPRQAPKEGTATAEPLPPPASKEDTAKADPQGSPAAGPSTPASARPDGPAKEAKERERTDTHEEAKKRRKRKSRMAKAN